MNIFLTPFRWILKECAHYSQWTELRKIGNQKIVQLTIVVPIIGTYILFGQEFCDFVGSKDFTNNIGLACGVDGEPSWKTFFLYYGFIFISIASIWYAFLCPKEIKDNESEYEFESVMNKYLTQSRIIYMNRKLNDMCNSMMDTTKRKYLDHIGTLYPLIYRVIKDGIKAGIDNTEIEKLLEGIIKREEKGDFLMVFYIALEFQHSISRYIILLFYILGFLLLAVSAIATIISVTVIAFSKLPNPMS